MSNISVKEKERLVKLVMEKIKENRISKNEPINDKSFVAISDFHGYDTPIKKIEEQYLKEYECIYILGDVTDRGPKSGIETLKKIKELTEKYPNRIFYIPGNHDKMLVGAVEFEFINDIYSEHDYANGGTKTIKDAQKLRENDPREYNKLMNWLLKQPLQRTHIYKGQQYVLAHAFFDQKIYDQYPNFSLLDLFKELVKGNDNESLYKAAERIIWFRKSKGDSTEGSCLSADSIMVIGHNNRPRDNYDLKDENDKIVKVHCVDRYLLSGSYGNEMYMYDGGLTEMVSSLTVIENNTESLEEKRNLLDNYIIKKFMSLISKDSEESIFENCRAFLEKENFISPIPDISEKDCLKIIRDYEVKSGFSYGDCSINEAYSIYKKVVLFNKLIDIHLTKYSDINEIAYHLNTFMTGSNEYTAATPELITSEQGARLIACVLGSQNMMELLYRHGCKNIEEYVSVKFDNNNYHR